MPSLPTLQRRHTRAFVAIVGTFILLATVAALAGSPAAVRAAEHGVQIADDAFRPSTVTVAVGDTITWTNADSSPHTVTAEDGSFASGNLDEGQGFSHSFTAPGTYQYRCDYHSDMVATVVVEAGAAEPAATAPAASAAPAARAAAADGAQPNTALPAPAAAQAPMAALLIGLGLVAFAFGLVPTGRSANAGAPAGGWRR